MGCFSWQWLEYVLLWLIIVGGIVAVLRILVPRILALFGVEGALIMQIINIVILVIVLCAIVIFVFDLFSCVGGIGLPGRR